jgi:hypothetical protein
VISEFTVAESRRSDPYSTTKCLEGTKIRFSTIALFKGRKSVGFAWESVFDAEVMMEHKWPEKSIETSTREHDMKGITNGLVGSFDASILMRTIRASGANTIAKLFEHRIDFRILVEFSALVEVDILVGNARRIAEDEPVVKPHDRCTFGNVGSPI